jgi:hypothetical protein
MLDSTVSHLLHHHTTVVAAQLQAAEAQADASATGYWRDVAKALKFLEQDWGVPATAGSFDAGQNQEFAKAGYDRLAHAYLDRMVAPPNPDQPMWQRVDGADDPQPGPGYFFLVMLVAGTVYFDEVRGKPIGDLPHVTVTI